MKIAVTGPRGFIAKKLISSLKKAHHDVHLIDRGMSGEVLSQFFKDQKPEVVIHLATLFLKNHHYPDISLLMESNLTFTTELLENSVTNGVKQFVGFGTYYQFPEPASLYAATKAAMEPIFNFYAIQKKLPITELYLYDTYGPGDVRDKILNVLAKAASSGQRLELSPGEQKMKLLHVDDVVSAIESAMDRPLSMGKVVRFAVEPLEALTLKNLALCVERVSGKKIDAIWGAKPYTPGVQMNPEFPYPALSGWKAQKTMDQGLVEVLKTC